MKTPLFFKYYFINLFYFKMSKTFYTQMNLFRTIEFLILKFYYYCYYMQNNNNNIFFCSIRDCAEEVMIFNL